jgi:tetratricopeptide (TPR) repeat protein
MSFKEIKELRQAGKLDEALQMANQALEAEPENIWNKRAAAWVYYDYLKKYAQPEQYEAFKEYLIKISDLQLPEDEKMVFDNCAWQIGSLVFSLQKAEQVDFGRINELFDLIRTFYFTKPSEAYSFIYKAFHKGYQNWSSYLTFADWWNFENLSSQDYLKEDFNGKKMMSIAEQAYIAYSKKLLEGNPLDSFGQQREIDKDKILSFLPKLDFLIEKHPDYQYPPYFKAKLLLALGNDENVLSAFLPFAKQKRNDFWVWELMAEIFLENKEIQFACYCKALSLKTPEDFLIKLRQSFAEMLIHKGMYNEAKTEILKVISTREKHQWKIPSQISQWIETEWYKSATAKKDNSDLYLSNVKKAEEILFQDIQEELIVVEFVNENKNMLSFVKDKQKHGFFNYSGKLTKPQIGDLLKVRFSGAGQDGFYKVLSAENADAKDTSTAIRDFEGIIKINENGKFGFVEDVFIEPSIIAKMNLQNQQKISGTALLSFNKKKNEWGWKGIEVIIKIKSLD